MMKRTLLLIVILLTATTFSFAETDWRGQAKACAEKYEQQKKNTQKEIIKRIKAEKDLEIEKKKKGLSYVIKYPIIDGGLSNEEMKGCIWTALAIWTNSPLPLLGLAF